MRRKLSTTVGSRIWKPWLTLRQVAVACFGQEADLHTSRVQGLKLGRFRQHITSPPLWKPVLRGSFQVLSDVLPILFTALTLWLVMNSSRQYHTNTLSEMIPRTSPSLSLSLPLFISMLPAFLQEDHMRDLGILPGHQVKLRKRLLSCTERGRETLKSLKEQRYDAA